MTKSPESMQWVRAALAGMEAELRRVVLGEMRPAPELAELADRAPDEMLRNLERWNAEGRILSVRHEGIEYFALFALNPQNGYHPYPVVAEAIRILSEVLDCENPWGMAGWFLGLNSFLDDQRPVDLLEQDPAWVIEAARDEVNSVKYPHG